VIIESNKTTLRKFLPPELLLHIYSNNFINWDFFTINYLISLKDFRSELNKSLSKNPKHSNKDEILQESMNSSKMDFSLKHKSQLINKSQQQGKVQSNISPIKEINKISTYCNYSHSFSYLYTGSDYFNHIHKIYSYQLTVVNNFPNLENKQEFKFDFNFKQMRILERISDDWDLDRFFRKILIIDKRNGKVKLDYEYFENFSQSFFKFIKKINIKQEECRDNIKMEIKY
jgi:hypothetical protein